MHSSKIEINGLGIHKLIGIILTHFHTQNLCMEISKCRIYNSCNPRMIGHLNVYSNTISRKMFAVYIELGDTKKLGNIAL